MDTALDTLSKRIIICAANEIIPHIQSGNIGAIITVTSSAEAELFEDVSDLDLPRYITSLHNNHGLFENAEDQAAMQAWAVRNDLDMAKDYLDTMDNKKLLMHCSAGAHKSPTFALMLLLHMNENANIDSAIRTIYSMRPQTLLSTAIPLYKEFLGDEKYSVYRQAIADFMRVKAINKCRNTEDLEKTLSTVFEEGTSLSTEQLSALCSRFGIQPTVLSL